MALFGEQWTRSFGEIPDESGQWTQTLKEVSRRQIADGLDVVRKSGRKWPPAAPEFRAICLNTGADKNPPFEICAVEIQNFVRFGRKDTHTMTPFVYHMVVKNLDFYNFKKLEKEYDRNKALEIAYKATLFQLECGEKLIAPPPPETLLESKKQDKASNDMQKGVSPINELLAPFEEPQQPKQLTQAEIDAESREQAIDIAPKEAEEKFECLYDCEIISEKE